MYQRYHLSHADARQIIDHLGAKLDEKNLGAAVAVTDSQGELIAFLRTDTCPLPSIRNAINKAYTASREKTDSANIGKASRNEGFPITNFGDLRYTGWGGGVPIIYRGEVIGAVGVSGLPEEEDIRLARTAADFFYKLVM
jgi:glc operon protein GlcG